MRTLILLTVAAVTTAYGGDREDLLNLAQKTFDAIAAHDGDALQALFLDADVRVASIRDDGRLNAVPIGQFAKNLGASKNKLLERMWSPKVEIDGRLASVWTPYDFHRDGQFSHCGIDHFSFVRTANGWKIAALAYTHQTTGCAPSPLGPPKP